MKPIFILFLFLSVLVDGLNKASRINNTVQEAAVYYTTGQYGKAARLYQYLADSLGVKDEQLIANLAHAQFMTNNLNQAQKNYNRLVKSKIPILQSTASTQLGIIYFHKNNPERALYYFKKAIIQNPLNDIALFNYELLQKYLTSHQLSVPPPGKKAFPDNKPEPPPQENTPQATKQPADGGNTGLTENNKSSTENLNPEKQQEKKVDQNGGTGKPQSGNLNQKNQNGKNENIPSGEKGDRTKGLKEDGGDNINTTDKGESELASEQAREMQTLRNRLQQSDLSPEKAKMLLEAMRQAEMQYLQQLPRKPKGKLHKTYPNW